MKTVITYQRQHVGGEISVCSVCEARGNTLGYALGTVQHGAHEGRCDACEPEADEVETPAPYAVEVRQVDPDGPDLVVCTFEVATEDEARVLAEQLERAKSRVLTLGSNQYAQPIKRTRIEPWYPEPGIQDGWDIDAENL